jgi:hypothetical protein
MREQELANNQISISEVSEDFVKFVTQSLNINKMPRIEFGNDLGLSDEYKTFGLFQQSAGSIRIQTLGRHLLDVLRTLAHELVHHKQQTLGHLDDGTDIQDLEDHANAVAGRLLRDYYKKHPEYFSATASRLTEDTEPETSTVPWDRIRTECSEILNWNHMVASFLYHGNRHHAEDWYLGEPPQNRRPKDTPTIIQNYIDYYFQKAGFRALRSNSIFTSPNFRQAADYGTVYMIFPRDGFAWTGSTLVRDLYSDDPLGEGWVKNNWNPSSLTDDLRSAFYAAEDKIPEPVKTAVTTAWLKFKNYPIKMSEVNPSTILLSSTFEKYASASAEMAKLHERYNIDTLVTPKQFVSVLGYNQSNLAQVMRNNTEIIIHGEYYAVHGKYQQEAEIRLLTS